MEQRDLSTANMECLKNQQCLEADLEIARRIVENDKAAVDYFLTKLSIPFLDYIGKNIMYFTGVYINGALRYYPCVSGEYYEFIGAQFTDGEPTWHKISLYKGLCNKGYKNARLYSYVSAITLRHFVNVKKKENKEISLDELLENKEIAILREYNGFDEISLEDVTGSSNTELSLAWSKLPRRDQLILKYLVIDELNPLDIFDEMSRYINTRRDVTSFTKRQKQDAMSNLKLRAQAHLRKLILEIRKA